MIIDLEKYKLLNNIKSDEDDLKLRALIEMVESDFLFIRAKAFDKDENSQIIYPENSEAVALDMLNYKLQDMKRIGLNSESIGDYSYSKTSSPYSYPTSIIKRITRFARAR